MHNSTSTTPLDLPSQMSSLTSIDSVDIDPFSEELHLAKSRPISPQRNTQQVDSDSDSDELTKLEMELKCSVCNDFYDVPMSSKCQHTFCAGCTKFDCNNKTTALCCPICENSFTTFTQLYKNTLIEELIKEYKTNRGLITNLYALGKKAKRRISSGELKEPIKASDSFMSISDCNSDFSPVEEKTKFKRTLEKSNDSDGNEQKRRRLDGNNNKNSTKPSKKPKLAYSVMNDRKLKNLLKEEGLLTHGSKNEMIARHSYFINLYNSNVDATNPKSKGELLREVKKWERAQQSDEAKNANLIKKSLTNPEEVNFYARKYHDHYAELIQQVRNNKKRKEISH